MSIFYFRVEFALLATCFTLLSCLAYSSTLKMEAKYYSESSADFQWNTWLYIPEDRDLFTFTLLNETSFKYAVLDSDGKLEETAQ
jgi:hypothetical protein